MMLGARTGAWAKSGSPTPTAYGGLCFTAEADNSYVKLVKGSSAPVVSIVKSFDGFNWENYTVGEVIELQNIGDSVYLAAGSGGNDSFSKGIARRASNRFVIGGLVSASGDITSIRNFNLEQTPLAAYCFAFLFSDCTGITSAPELQSNELGESCYYSMFNGCTNLKSIKVNFTVWRDGSTTNWIDGVHSSGTFYKPSALAEEYGSNRIPNGWTVVNID